MGRARWTGTGLALASLALVASGDEPAVPRFADVTGAAGLTGVAACRVACTDMDGDGFPEILVVERGAGEGGVLRLFRNAAVSGPPGGRGFTDASAAAGVRAGGPGGGESRAVFAVTGDVDNDGWTDLVRAVYQQPADHPTAPDTGERTVLLRGSPDGTFVVTDAGLGADGPVTTCAAVLVDANLDGHLDVFTGNWYVHYGKDLVAHPNRLFLGNGRGRFRDGTAAAGLATCAEPGLADSSRPTYGVGHADVDGDGWPDLLAANYGRQWNRVWHNNGDGTFADWGPRMGVDGDADRDGRYPAWIEEHPRLKGRAPEPPFRSNGNTFALVPADADNDGWMDLASLEITHGWAGPSSDLSAILWNGGPWAAAPFVFARDATALARPRVDDRRWNQGDVSGAWGDLDNDGWLDLVLGSTAYPDNQRLRVFRQVSPRRFADATAAFGLDFPDCNQVVVADVDGDGWLDLLAAGGATAWNKRPAPIAAVFRNGGVPGRHWVALTLEGDPAAGANRSAIGARVEVTAGGLTQTREVCSGAGHFGQAPDRTLHFGLGAATTVDRVRIRWPNRAGTVEVRGPLAADRRHTVRQGETGR